MLKKTCRKCRVEKDAAQFYRDRKSADGLQGWCKPCALLSVKAAPSSGSARKPRTKEQGRLRYERDKLRFNFSRRMRAAIGGRKTQKWELLVDYTLSDLKAHLEVQFRDSMSWDNYGKLWHIDHKRPVANFGPMQAGCPTFKECWALANLQPLLATENISKGARYTPL